MLIKLAGGTLYDPSQDWNGVIRDLFVRDGRIIDDPGPGANFDDIHEVRGMVVMAGGIDIHSHIAGGNVNTARMLQPEQFLMREDPDDLPPVDRACFTAAEIGEHYARMGYTTVIEPAVLPCNARDAHLQMIDIPVIDKAALAILGNDEFLLRLLRQGGGQSLINDYVAWTIEATQCLALKCINAGGGAAFKQNVRAFNLDDEVPSYGVTSRQILQSLHRAAITLSLPHPLHVHCNNLGLPGSIDSVLATMEVAEGAPMHLAHVQFYGYGQDGPLGISSAAAQIIAGLEKHPNITIDVGQVLFGQTVTISGDVIAQYSHRNVASPKKWVLWDGECEGGGGVVPMRYRPQSFINSLQWAIGLELFLLAPNPSRVFFTTDHPNGAPFTRYPELIRLLMDREFRNACLETIHPEARAMTLLQDIKREFSLYEIATMTRTAPARLLGLSDRGTLRPGGKADIAVYNSCPDAARMFGRCALLLKDGALTVRQGEMVNRCPGATISTSAHYDGTIEPKLRRHFDAFGTVALANYKVSRDEFSESGRVLDVRVCA